MINNQFELNGVTFGEDCPVDITPDGWKPNAGEQRNSVTPNPTRNGVRFGRDLRGSALWEWTVFTNLEDEAPAWDALADLKEAWDADEIREEPGEVTALRYQIAGKVRRVYGRPRRFSQVVDNKRLGGNIGAVVDFELVEDTVYDDDVNSVSIPLGLPFDPDAGIILPAIFPLTLEGGSVAVESAVTVGGERRTPIWITFYGPISNALVQIGDVKAGLSDVNLDNDPATIDGRPWKASATRESGGGVRVNPTVTRISKMWLEPGRYPVIITGTDPTGGAYVTVSWRNARRNIR